MSKRIGVALSLLAAVAAPSVAGVTPEGSDSACAKLTSLPLGHVTIALALPIERGKFIAPDGQSYQVEAFCRVRGEARSVADSSIGFELWMPARSWNGRYYQLGNGGFAGSIHYPSLAAELRRGNAVALTDTGHRGGGFDASWAHRHPQKIIDYGYRSLQQTSDAAKSLMHAYYGQSPRYTYFAGCSNGGRQALMLAQRYPDDCATEYRRCKVHQ